MQIPENLRKSRLPKNSQKSENPRKSRPSKKPRIPQKIISQKRCDFLHFPVWISGWSLNFYENYSFMIFGDLLWMNENSRI